MHFNGRNEDKIMWIDNHWDNDDEDDKPCDNVNDNDDNWDTHNEEDDDDNLWDRREVLATVKMM